MEEYEIVQRDPETIYRKIYNDSTNNSKNEYYHNKLGKEGDYRMSGPFPDIKSAIEDYRKAE